MTDHGPRYPATNNAVYYDRRLLWAYFIYLSQLPTQDLIKLCEESAHKLKDQSHD